jgi:protein-L-isoaspartate(D-aspartate) O-methyltransferase
MAYERSRMVEAVRNSILETTSYTGISRLSEGVQQALEKVPRHRFVPDDVRARAYVNSAQPIEHGQTISQPLIVALMTQLLEPGPDSVILEVGTGSGYQAAILAELVKHVYSVEIVPELAESAAKVLQELDYDNVSVRAGDGYAGWPEYAPFDGIVVTAAAPQIPPPLLEQLKPGAPLVIPVGEHMGYQELVVVRVDKGGEVSRRTVLPVRFVPLTGDR